MSALLFATTADASDARSVLDLGWRYFFPANVRFVAVTGRNASDATPREDPTNSVAVAPIGALAAISSAERWYGLILFGREAVSHDALIERGFSHVREYRAFPTFAAMRWLIPFGDGAASAAGLEFHPPYRAPARLARAALRLAARARSPFIFRDRVYFAQRYAPPLQTAMQDAVGVDEARFAFAWRTPDHVEKPIFAVVSRHGRVLAYAKLADSPFRTAALENEAEVLRHLGSRAATSALAPSLRFAGTVDGRYLSVQDVVRGRNGPARFSKAHRSFLGALLVAERAPITSTVFARRLLETAAADRRPEWTRDVLARMRRLLDGVSAPTAAVHGDFAPWNLRLRDGRLSAFDWEWGATSGPPLVDLMHHQLQVGFLLERWDIDRAEGLAMELALSRPFGLEPHEVYAIETLGLLDYFGRLLDDGHPQESFLAARYRRLVERTAARAAEPAAI